MRLEKTSEKILVWQHRNGISQQAISNKIGITRQTFAAKMKDNLFSVHDILILKSMGFEG
jgi:DNA-binding XRE family transcriptional regulator